MRPKLKKLLEQPVGRSCRGGVPCSTCAHKQIRAINADIGEFAKARAEGHELPWSAFFRAYLRPEFGIKLGDDAIMKHVRRCLGEKA